MDESQLSRTPQEDVKELSTVHLERCQVIGVVSRTSFVHELGGGAQLGAHEFESVFEQGGRQRVGFSSVPNMDDASHAAGMRFLYGSVKCREVGMNPGSVES